MRGLLADVNCEGQVEVLVAIFLSKTWKGVWRELNLSLETFTSAGLPRRALDVEVWQLCQKLQLLLITRNRNRRGADSLEAAISELNQPDSLPVITLTNADRILGSKLYANRVAERLLDYLIDLDKYRGTGRLWVP
jgi:hypothetical protein